MVRELRVRPTITTKSVHVGDKEEETGFCKTLSIKLGEGIKVPIWTSRWIGHRPLCSVFPLLFQEVENKCICV